MASWGRNEAPARSRRTRSQEPPRVRYAANTRDDDSSAWLILGLAFFFRLLREGRGGLAIAHGQAQTAFDDHRFNGALGKSKGPSALESRGAFRVVAGEQMLTACVPGHNGIRRDVCDQVTGESGCGRPSAFWIASLCCSKSRFSSALG
jgi:hypothetical protein